MFEPSPERIERLGSMDSPHSPIQKSWKEYEDDDEIPIILSEGLLPVKFQSDETVRKNNHFYELYPASYICCNHYSLFWKSNLFLCLLLI